MKSLIQNAKRVIVKVGSSLVTNDGRGIDPQAIGRWSAQIAQLRILGMEVVLVSSGAVAEGMQRLGFTSRPANIYELQACAAVGQMGLAHIYEQSFRNYGISSAQILLTHADLADRERYLNARSTLFTLLSLKVIPVINENDTVVTDEIKFGDNDTLGALVTNLIDADALVILTDQNGLYEADPRKNPNAQLVQFASAADPALQAMAGSVSSNISCGGMLTKILAAKRAASSGAHTVIASGREENVLLRLAQGEMLGTQLCAQTGPLRARQQWMVDHLHTRGRVVLDSGAVKKVVSEGKSLLPIGVLAIEGEFSRGMVITCMDESGRTIARGITNYASADARRIIGLPSSTIADALGYTEGDELIHRDNLVVL